MFSLTRIIDFRRRPRCYIADYLCPSYQSIPEVFKISDNRYLQVYPESLIGCVYFTSFYMSVSGNFNRLA